MGNTSSNSSSSSSLDPNSITGNPQDPDYWRRKGDAHAQARNAAFAGSQAAFHRGDHGEAGRLSRQGKQHDAQCKECNAKASQLAFDTNNRGRGLGEVDLHGLRVAEAEEAAERAIRRAKEAGLPRVVLIVGKGLHSRDGVAKLRPAVERLVARHNLRCIPGQPNAGCITAEFVSREQRGIVGWLLDMCVIC